MMFLIPEDSMIVGCMSSEIHNNISTPSGSDVKLCHGKFLNIFSALVKEKNNTMLKTIYSVLQTSVHGKFIFTNLKYLKPIH